MSPLIQTIYKHVVEEGDCWNWNGALQGCGATPMMKHNGKPGAVRRFILLEHGPAPKNKPLASYSCGNAACVNPEHMTWMSNTAIQKRTSKEQQFQQCPVRNKKIAEKRRQNTKLTREKAAEVREADGTQAEIAKRFGVSKTTVGVIKRGESWRTYAANPFSGLGVRV